MDLPNQKYVFYVCCKISKEELLQTLLCDFISVKYDTLLCTWNIMPLAQYLIFP